MEEPSLIIRYVIYFFASGVSAGLGLIALALTVTMMRLGEGRWQLRRSFLVVVSVVCLVLIVCGSPSMPVTSDLVAGMLLSPLAMQWFKKRFAGRTSDERDRCPAGSEVDQSGSRSSGLRKFVRGPTQAIWPMLSLLPLIAVEWPSQVWWPLDQPVTRLLVIGDSVTAGLNEGEHTWPKILAEQRSIEVVDASQPGATLASARRQNACFNDSTGTVILEIGGNDLLEGLPCDQFAGNLDRLLSDVSRPDRTIVMFELPLPPLCARYGMIQRQLARQYHVHLIPRRLFVEVLTTSGATVDGIHLSVAGQAQMARLVTSLLKIPFNQGNNFYQRHER